MSHLTGSIRSIIFPPMQQVVSISLSLLLRSNRIVKIISGKLHNKNKPFSLAILAYFDN